MVEKHLAVYLSDHYAGGIAALEILSYLERGNPGTMVERVATQLQTEVKADHEELEALMRRAGISPSRTRQATAWLTEKAAELKLRLDDPTDGALRLFETLEALALGIDGKRALWDALAAVAKDAPALQGINYPRLIQRADDQRRRVEGLRLSAANDALATAATAAE